MKGSTLGLLTALLLLSACDRENRRFREAASAVPVGTAVQVSDLQPGAPTVDYRLSSFAENNAYAIAEGKKLYMFFNCVGCHAHGGGGMGPPLMDDEWIYGSEPENIYATIVEGRPNGMPSFRGRIPADRLWWLVAYVRSMSALNPKSARPGRSDDMQVKIPELRRTRVDTLRSSPRP